MNWTPTRLWTTGTAAVCVLLLVASWFLLLAPQRAEASDLREQTTSTTAQNEVLATRIAELKADFAKLPEYKEQLAALQGQLPSTTALPDLVRELEGAAATAGVTLVSVTPGTPEPFLDPAAAPAAAPEAVDGAEGTATTPAAPAGPAASLVSVPMSVVVVGDFFRAESFLRAVQEDLARAFLVTDLTVGAQEPGDGGGGLPASVVGDVSMTVAGSVFVLSDSATAATSVGLPTAAATPTPTGTPTGVPTETTTSPAVTPTEQP